MQTRAAYCTLLRINRWRRGINEDGRKPREVCLFLIDRSLQD